MSIKMSRPGYRGLSALCALTMAAGVATVAGCSDEFSNCRETYTCPKGGASSDAGAAGAGDTNAGGVPNGTGGAEPGSTGSGGAAAATGAESGAGGSGGSSGPEPGSLLGDACDESGALSCNGSAQKLTLLCKDGVWTERDVCASDENCDETTGVCAPITEECASKRSGELYCTEDRALYRCGPDLVSTELVEQCEGNCVAAAGSASCVPAGCGDGIVQSDEACDDKNSKSGDGCSAACEIEPIQLTVASGFFKVGDPAGLSTCALGSNGKIRCFKPGETDWTWVDVPLGASEEATAIAGSGNALCALFKDGTVRCWGGWNDEGMLGLGDKTPRPLGQPSANVDLGPGEVATSVSVGQGHACAVVNNGRVKCWGRNYDDQLGYPFASGNPHVGDMPGDMGSNLASVATSLVDRATSVILGQHHSCALRVDKSVRCWGTEGNLDNSGAEFLQFSTYGAHRCAILVNGSTKCWGTNSFGELGQDSTTPHLEVSVVDAVALGPGRQAKSVAAGPSYSCAILDNGAVKCWGINAQGQLGAGHTDNIGDSAGEMAALKPVDLGPGRKAEQIALGEETACVLLEDGQVTCWGKVNLPASDVLGDGPNETGNKLPIVPLRF